MVKNREKAQFRLFVVDDGNNRMLEVRAEKVSNCNR